MLSATLGHLGARADAIDGRSRVEEREAEGGRASSMHAEDGWNPSTSGMRNEASLYAQDSSRNLLGTLSFEP